MPNVLLKQSKIRFAAMSASEGRLCREVMSIFYDIDRDHSIQIQMDATAYASLLTDCTNNNAMEKGKEVHAHMIKSGMKSSIFLGSKLVSMYAGCGNLVDACLVFDRMPKRNALAWNEMIRGCATHGYFDDAFMLYYRMQIAGIRSDHFTFPFVLKACASTGALQQGKEIHAHIIKSGFESDVYVGSSLADMYAKCGNLEIARQVFEKMSQRNLVSWNAMIGGHVQNGKASEALKIFSQLQLSGMKANSITIASVLPACAELASMHLGKEIHGYIVKSGFEYDVFVVSAIVDMYAKCGNVDLACRVFERNSHRNVVSWNAMIVGYVQNGCFYEALKLFHQMQLVGMKPSSVTISSVLQACAHSAGLQQGKEIHGYVIKSGLELDVFVGSALIDMYAKCSCIDIAELIFDGLREKNVVTWNAMIAGYAQNGYCDEGLELFCQMQAVGKIPNLITWNALIAGYASHGHANEALKLFYQMQLTGTKANVVTLTSVFAACSSLAAMQQGKEIHGYTIRSGFESDLFVGSALIDMYAKCGIIEVARHLFDAMHIRDVVSWNAMIVGYGMHGYVEDALTMFRQMQKECTKPNRVTFIALLSACSHAGLVAEGWQFFHSMSRDYCITPGEEHYACMVDLLGRAGHLDEVQDFIKMMPLEPSVSVFGALLGACRIHGNIELGEHAADHLFKMQPENSGYYVLLSNIYAKACRWDDVAKLRAIVKKKGLKKSPGWSWIEIKNEVHTFIVGDR